MRLDGLRPAAHPNPNPAKAALPSARSNGAGPPATRRNAASARSRDLPSSSGEASATARACDRGETTREDAAGAILYAAERATWMALEAIQCLGGNGYINDVPAGRLLRDAKLYEIGAGTSEIRRMLIGRELFDKTQ